jgi:hypothetical protein
MNFCVCIMCVKIAIYASLAFCAFRFSPQPEPLAKLVHTALRCTAGNTAEIRYRTKLV